MGTNAMHILGYIAIGFLIVCVLLAATKGLSVGAPSSTVRASRDMAQVIAPDTTQSPRQPNASPISQQQNQTDSAQERLHEAADEGKDLLNILD